MIEPVVRISGLTKTYRDATALDGVSFDLMPDTLYGLLGRNGAGKTTVMSILTGQNFASSGSVEVFGQRPLENRDVLRRMCFIRESQKYPDNFNAAYAFRAAAMFFPRWDQQLCEQLTADFELPVQRKIKRLSRGQLSAVGVIIGL